jgi:hypothetical protein
VPPWDLAVRRVVVLLSWQSAQGVPVFVRASALWPQPLIPFVWLRLGEVGAATSLAVEGARVVASLGANAPWCGDCVGSLSLGRGLLGLLVWLASPRHEVPGV